MERWAKRTGPRAMRRRLGAIAIGAFVTLALTGTALASDAAAADGPTIEDARRIVAAALADECPLATGERSDSPPVEAHAFEHVDADGRHAMQTLFSVPCDLYAYQGSVAFVLADEYGALRLLAFPVPSLDVAYKDSESNVLEAMRIDGYTATLTLVEGTFDAQSATVTQAVKWRGLGDAAAVSSWNFDGRNFRLRSYEVDPTFDGKLQLLPVYPVP